MTPLELNIIYIATCVVTNMSYVGLTTKGLKRRRQDHENESRSENPLQYFHRAIAKYGRENFEWGVLCSLTDEEVDNGVIDEMEILAIDLMGTLAPAGYNRTTGGRTKRKPRPRRRKLPKYVYSYKARGREGYIAEVDGKKRYISDMTMSMPDKLRVITDWVKKMKAGETVPSFNKRHVESNKQLPPYISLVTFRDKNRKTPLHGYTVQKTGIRQRSFLDSRVPLPDRLAAAEAYLASATVTE